ncbi:MAG TPA: aminopeptidase [Anaerolineae bacterium]|nr:aminopeptidase [Anaerolineae bacterium]
MLPNFEINLQKYAELLVRVGLNLQPHQRLLIYAPWASAPLVHQVAARAYQIGAPLVEAVYYDDQLILTRFEYGPREFFDEVSPWRNRMSLEYAQRGDAVLTISGQDPDLLKGQDPELIKRLTLAANKMLMPYAEEVAKDSHNWVIASYPTAAWAAKVFPAVPAEQRADKLWAAIFKTCRIDQPDPITAWQTHLQQLAACSAYLNGKHYAALHYQAPGTDLTIGLADTHRWVSGATYTPTGIKFTANLPTEEVFTLPHKDRINGTVHATKPLSYSGVMIEDFSLTFKDGHVVELHAAQGEEVLRGLVATDAGASSLGEVALVPHNSPISQSGLLFFNTLFDENAACHIALGRGFHFCVDHQADLLDEEFAARGGNQSLIHVDFMIGSDQLNIDGVTAEGRREPILRGGEWAFAL